MVLTGRRTPVGQIQVGRGRSGTSTQVIGHRYSMAGPQHSPGTHDTCILHKFHKDLTFLRSSLLVFFFFFGKGGVHLSLAAFPSTPIRGQIRLYQLRSGGYRTGKFALSASPRVVKVCKLKTTRSTPCQIQRQYRLLYYTHVKPSCVHLFRIFKC